VKMQAMIFPLADVCANVTLPPTIDPILAEDRREQNAGADEARARGARSIGPDGEWAEAPVAETETPHSTIDTAARSGDPFKWRSSRRHDVVRVARI
jgi:hypothetical protein